jgi:DNA-binding NtrC family response regulator
MTKSDDAGFRILIVDDNKELREILQEYLADDADSVSGATNGKEAIEKHEQDRFDLIITDLMMPEITGMELIKRIRTRDDMTEFIIITGYASLDSAMEAVKIGAFDYIVKPFRMEELKVVVKNARDKITLRKVNKELFRKLESFYQEMNRYKQDGEKPEDDKEAPSDTERIIDEIRNLDGLKKGRLLID